MKTGLMGALVGALLAGCTPETVFFVAPDGNDANAGTAGKPFATLNRAREAVRAALSDPTGTGGIRVVLKDGVYSLEQSLELTSADSGTAARPVAWCAENRTKATLSGAVDLPWRKPGADEIPAMLPEASRAKVLVADLPGTNAVPGFAGGFGGKRPELSDVRLVFYQDGKKLEPAREPKASDSPNMVRAGRGFGTQLEDIGGGCMVYMDGSFEFDDKARLRRWAAEPDLWAFGFWHFHWAELSSKVKAVDAEKGTMTVDFRQTAYGLNVKGGGDRRFYVFNAFSALTEPGEYVLDRRSRRVWAIPRAGGLIRLSKGPSLVVAKGLSNVSFEGLTFEYALKDGLVFADTTNVAVRASVVRSIGATGVVFKGGRDGRLDGCDIYDLGDTAVVAEGGDRMRLVPGNHVVDNCHIHHHGRTAPSSPGVRLAGVGNRLQHSLVHHTDSQAVIFNGNDHYVGYNVMHDLCEHNWDAGGIYGYMCNRHERGTVIEYNVVHSTGPQPRFGSELMAIYLDAFTSGVTVRGNIVSRTRRGIFANGGVDNVYKGNLIVNCPVACYHFCLSSTDEKQVKRYAPLAVHSLRSPTFTNALWRARYPTMLKVLDIPDVAEAIKSRWNVMDGNVLLASGELGFRHPEINTVTNTVNFGFRKDPGFVDYDGFDWRAKPGSELAKAFPDNRFDRMGLYASEWRVSPPVKHGEGMTRPRPLIGEWGWGTPLVELTRTDVPPRNFRPYLTDFTNCHPQAEHVWHEPQSAKTDWTEQTFGFTPLEDATIRVNMGGHWGGEKVLVDDVRVTGAELKDGGFERGYVEKGGVWTHSTRLKDPPWSNQFEPYGILESVPQNGVEGAIRPAEGRKMACVCAEQRVWQQITVKKGVPVRFAYKFLSYLPYNQEWK